MNNLTVALAALGGVVLIALVAHGAWQARRAGPKRPAQTVPIEPKLEPRLEPQEPALEAAPSSSEEGALVDATDASAAPGAILEHRAPRRSTARLDALIDAIAVLTIESPISAESVLPHLPPTRRAGSKPFFIEGLDAETGEWESPQAGRRYGEFQAGVQLANRTGPLNEIEYSEFVQKVQGFAEAIGAMVDLPDMLDAVARARELDTFAVDHDAQLAVHLRARGTAWSVGYIQQHASRQGFVAGVVPGRLVMPAGEEGAPPVLTLTFDSQAAFEDDPNKAAVRDVTLNFDVPQTDARSDPFAAWQASAQALSQAMDADIVDDLGRAFGPEGFTAIADELTKLYARLAERDLAAGSAAARRLFA